MDGANIIDKVLKGEFSKIIGISGSTRYFVMFSKSTVLTIWSLKILFIFNYRTYYIPYIFIKMGCNQNIYKNKNNSTIGD